MGGREEFEIEEPEGLVEEGTNNISIVLSKIKEKDTGEGADLSDVADSSGVEDAERIIQLLINEGEVFEIKPGKIKILD